MSGPSVWSHIKTALGTLNVSTWCLFASINTYYSPDETSRTMPVNRSQQDTHVRSAEMHKSQAYWLRGEGFERLLTRGSPPPTKDCWC